MEQAMTLRERKKAETRATVLRVANELFRQRGFEQTTVEEICAEALVSKRTLFRYFGDKEGLVFPNREERLEAFRTFLQGHPPTQNPFDTLRAATRVWGAEYNEARDRILAQQRLVESSGALVSREREIDREWEQEIAAAFARMTGADSRSDLWARVLAGAIMGVIRATMTYWFEGGGEADLVALGLDAIDKLESGFPVAP
jgi:AcrR family transcriptional regulator